MTQQTPLLIIGAGPFGLATAAYAQHLGIDYLILGKPMDFWKANMPDGMYLRSASDWHLDPVGIHTIEEFLARQNLTPADVEPLSRDFYLSYCQWFQEQKHITPTPGFVRQLDYSAASPHPFTATLDDGRTIQATNVVIAPGFKHFKQIPPELAEMLPPGRYDHTCDLVDFTQLAGKRILIIGGRQSAFEWTALLNEAGAASVDLTYRHDSPAFREADWSWVSPMVDALIPDPGWFRRLSQPEKDEIGRRLWAEGRLKVEPWLESRAMTDTVHLWPKTHLVACQQTDQGDLLITLNNGQQLTIDYIILATGYKVKIDQLPLLAQGNILPQLVTLNGFPVLDLHMQTNLPGLFITSMPAVQDFGPFFAFTISVRTSAHLIGQALSGS